MQTGKGRAAHRFVLVEAETGASVIAISAYSCQSPSHRVRSRSTSYSCRCRCLFYVIVDVSARPAPHLRNRTMNSHFGCFCPIIALDCQLDGPSARTSCKRRIAYSVSGRPCPRRLPLRFHLRRHAPISASLCISTRLAYNLIALYSLSNGLAA